GLERPPVVAAEEEAVAAAVRARKAGAAGRAGDPAPAPGLAVAEDVGLGLDEERARVARADDRPGSAGRVQADRFSGVVHVDARVAWGGLEPALDAAPDGRRAPVGGE